jgi:hypothetical protein
VELLRHRGPLVRRILEAATLHVGAQVDGGHRGALQVRKGQTGLFAVRSGHPTEQMVERPVLHHQHDDRVERRASRIG